MNKQINKEYKHVMDEIKSDNIYYSLAKGDLNKIEDLHYAIHAFGSLPTSIIITENDFKSKSAFLIYQHETYEMAHQSFIAALSGHYNSAYTLLRNMLELIIKGAFWEYVAHKRYREQLKYQTKGKKDTIRKFIEVLTEETPEFENQLEKLSASIFDINNQLIENKNVYMPNFREIITQLGEWGLFFPLDKQEAASIFYNELYLTLSKNVHVQPDSTDIGRRVSFNDEVIFKNSVIIKELDIYLNIFLKLIDLATLIELNVLNDSIINHLNDFKVLKINLDSFKSLNLTHAVDKLESLISDSKK